MKKLGGGDLGWVVVLSLEDEMWEVLEEVFLLVFFLWFGGFLGLCEWLW